jgi:hypothetical protein
MTTTSTLVRSPLELDLRCMISGAGMVVTANKFPMPILIAPHERLMVGAQDGYVEARRVDPGLAEATKQPPAATDRIELQNVEFRAARALAEALRIHDTVAVVDDDYPEVRHKYESAVRTLIDAFRGNGRIP